MSKSKEKTDAPAPAARISKIDVLVAMLSGPSGADVAAMALATGWQRHSVRGAIAGQIKKKLALKVEIERVDGRTLYRIPQDD